MLQGAGYSSATMRFMFHVVLECEAEGLSCEVGEQAATDVAEEFAHGTQMFDAPGMAVV